MALTLQIQGGELMKKHFLINVAKDIKQTIPILVLITFVMLYLALSTQDSLWVRVFEYYK